MYRREPLTARGKLLLAVLMTLLLLSCLVGVTMNMQKSLVRGHFGGVYWFIIGYPKLVFPLLCLALAYVLARPFLGRGRAMSRQPGLSDLITSIVMLAAIPLLLCLAGTLLLLSNLEHLDSATANRQRYYLAAQTQPIGGNNYLLLECDQVGFYCYQVWRSAPASYQEPHLLITDDGQVQVRSATEAIYTHRP